MAMMTSHADDPPLCDLVRSTCLAWTLGQGHDEVTINKQAIPRIASELIEQNNVTWDSEGWHYEPPKDWPCRIRDERVALYILALDAINFCFWPDASYEYEDLAVALTSIASRDHPRGASIGTYALSAKRLSSVSTSEMTALFINHDANSKSPPDMDKRCTLWNEIGSVLSKKFGGSALDFISLASSSAPKLVQLLVDHFPGFRDCSSNGDVWFLKRAQICVGDWNASLQLRLDDMDKLTTFADYRVPQVLREYEVLVYSERLSGRVDSQCELEAGGADEISIRAATVTAVELVVRELRDRGPSSGKCWTAVETDWFLWQLGEGMRNRMRPHHRVRTTFY
jgi:hypothetical protein